MTNQLIWRVYKKDSPKSAMILVGVVMAVSEDDCRTVVARNHWKQKYHEISPEDNLIFMN